MGAPKQVDTSKSQAKVEKAKLEAQKKADAFEDEMYTKQDELSKQGLAATLGIQEKQGEIGKIKLEQEKDNTKILTSFFNSINSVNKEQSVFNKSNEANLDKLFTTAKSPVQASFKTFANLMGK